MADSQKGYNRGTIWHTSGILQLKTADSIPPITGNSHLPRKLLLSEESQVDNLQSFGSPWQDYTKYMSQDLGGETIHAYNTHENNALPPNVTIRKVTGKAELLGELLHSSHKNLMQTFKKYKVPGGIWLIQERMDLRFQDVIGSPWKLEQKHIATVCSEV